MSAVDDFIIDGKPLSDLRVVDLKTQLEKRGLSKSGSKHVLVSRLRDHLMLEKSLEQQQHRDPNIVPNMEMKSCGSNIVADYLEKQQRTLQAAKLAAQAVRAASSSSFDDTDQSPIAAVESLVASLSPKGSFSPPPTTNRQPSAAEVAEIPLNLSKDEKEKSPEAKMAVEPAANGGGGPEEAEVIPEPDSNSDRHEESPTAPAAPQEEEEGDEVEISAPQNAADEIMEAVNAELITERKLSKEIPPTVETEVAEKRQRKRKWGSTIKRNTVSISSESLKEIVGPVTTVETATTPLDEPVQLDYDEEPVPKRIVISREDMDEEDNVEETTTTETTAAEKTEILPPPPEPKQPDDDGLIRERSASPARHPISRIIHIRGLTRPFTVPMLQNLAGKFGCFERDEFWIDAIKSHCFIKYETEEGASVARSKLDNSKWPSSNPHQLRVDFASQDDLDRHRNKAKNGKEQDQQPLSSKENQTDSKPKERVVREIRATDDEKHENRRRNSHHKSPSPGKRGDTNEKLWPKNREWDKGKDKDWKQSPPPSRDDRRNARRQSPSPRRRSGDDQLMKTREEVPAKLLDDLFRKTKTTPCIYWLPLTTDQVEQRETERKRRHLERAERLKQLEADERERRRGGGFDRRPPPYSRRR